MSETIREQIIQALQSKLEAIPAVVIRGLMVTDPADVPIISLLPGVESSERIRYGAQRSVLPIMVEARLSLGGASASSLGEAMLGKLIAAVMSQAGDRTCGGLAEDTQYLSGGIETYPEDGEQYVNVIAEFAVPYSTALGDPYTSA